MYSRGVCRTMTGALPTILFYHGITSSKEVYSYFAVALAQAGFRAVLPDADMHSSRYNGDTELRMTHFWDILKQNIDEVPQLEAALREKDWIADKRFAVAGASMGGMTALGAMARFAHIHSVACMMGCSSSIACFRRWWRIRRNSRSPGCASGSAGALRSQPAVGKTR